MNPVLVYYWVLFIKVCFLAAVLCGALAFDQLYELWRTRLPDWLEDVRRYNELEHWDLVRRCRAGRLVAFRQAEGKETRPAPPHNF